MNAPDSQPDMLDHDSAGVSKPVEAPRLVVRINSVAMKVRWLEANQPDVFKRGIWDAINAA